MPAGQTGGQAGVTEALHAAGLHTARLMLFAGTPKPELSELMARRFPSSRPKTVVARRFTVGRFVDHERDTVSHKHFRGSWLIHKRLAAYDHAR